MAGPARLGAAPAFRRAGADKDRGKEARGMRNILVHDYDGVNIGRVWDTEIEDIPVLRVAAEKYCKLTFSLNI